MFESKEEIRDAVAKVSALLARLDRGDILTHGDIEAVLGLAPHEGRWDTIVHKALDRLERDRGVAYWPMRMVGYRLLTQTEQTEKLPFLRMRKIASQQRKLLRSQVRLPDKGLTMHQRRVKAFNIDRIREQQRDLRLKKRELEIFLHPRPAHPLRPDPRQRRPQPPEARP